MAKKIYGKYADGKMEFYDWRTIFDVDGVKMNTSDPEVLAANGYKELVYVSPSPDDGYYTASFDWVETDSQYVQTWTYEPIPEEVCEPSVEERLEAVESALFEIIDMLVGGDA